MKKLLGIYLALVLIIGQAYSQESTRGGAEPSGGKLPSIEEETKGESGGRNRNSGSDNDDENTMAMVSALVEVMPYLLFTPIGTLSYSDYPYAFDSEGAYSEDSRKGYSLTASAAYLHESNSLRGMNFSLRYNFLPYTGIEMTYMSLGERAGIGSNALQIGDVFLNYNRIRTEAVSLWLGTGLKSLTGSTGQFAFALQAGTEIYPFSPLSISSNYSVGFFDGTALHDFKANLNFHFQRFFIQAGYNNISTSSVSLDMLRLGTGVNF